MQTHTTKGISQMVQEPDNVSRIIIYGAGFPTAMMGWLNENASGIEAACAIVAAGIMIYRSYLDWRRSRGD